MCGFAGEFLLTPGRADLELARKMADRITHRGPDEPGEYLSADGRCALGFRRLCVIDPPGSHQPMTTPDGQLTVAFNGEIYNFPALRRDLAADGARFTSAGDTEVLLHLYRRRGGEMLHDLTGMFAFALYDAAAGRLLLARDRLGQKPLWYAALPDRVIFASEAKALLVHPRIDRTMDIPSTYLYMSMGYVPAPHTAWVGARKLRPGYRLIAAAADANAHEPQVTVEPYWQLQAGDPPAGADTIDHVRRAVTEAVEARMISDVPLGALLSGGVDSAIVVALMARAAGKTGGVRTFTAGFDDREFDERPAARLVADHCGTEHTELLIHPDPADMLDRIVSLYDEPYADSSALPTWLICREARRHVTVALGGDGGDEVFGGYDRYRAMSLAESIGPARYLLIRLAARLARPFAPADERNRLRRFVRFADALPDPCAMQYFKYRCLFTADDLVRLFTADFAAAGDVHAPTQWFCDLYESLDLDSEVARAQHHDLMTYLPDDLLVKTDIASMASSLELRAPLLDHHVVQLGLSLPAHRKVDAKRRKIILREAFSDILPPQVFQARKRGFGVPLGRWLREDLRDLLVETLMDKSLERRGIFRRDALAGLINDHLSGRDDHRHRLWALLVFARWLQHQH